MSQDLFEEPEQIDFKVFAILARRANKHVLPGFDDARYAFVLEKVVLQPDYLAQVTIAHREEPAVWLVVPDFYLYKWNAEILAANCEDTVLSHWNDAEHVFTWEQLLRTFLVEAAGHWDFVYWDPAVLLAQNEEAVFRVSELAEGTERALYSSILEFSLVGIVDVKGTKGSIW